KLSALLDCDYYAKLENLQPTGAFKVRGGINLVGTASAFCPSPQAERGMGGEVGPTDKPHPRPISARGEGSTDYALRNRPNRLGHPPTLITASTGNHGQSIAYAGRLFDTRVIIYAPAENVNELKMQAMRELGAEVRLHGRDFDEAR